MAIHHGTARCHPKPKSAHSRAKAARAKGLKSSHARIKTARHAAARKTCAA